MAKIDTTEFRYARDEQGDPVDGALLFVFDDNTDTLVDIYTDDALSVSGANPVVATSGGDFTNSLFTDTTGILRLEIVGPLGNYLPNSPQFVETIDRINNVADNYTALATDAGKTLVVTNGSGVAVTINPGVFNIGDAFRVIQGGAGAVTVQGATVGEDTSTVNVDLTFTAVTAGQYSVATVICIDTDTYVITGDLVAA